MVNERSKMHVSLPNNVTMQMVDEFTPFETWKSKVVTFLDDGRVIKSLNIERVEIKRGSLMSMQLKGRVGLHDRTEAVSFTLAFPTVFMVLWCNDDFNGIRVLLTRKLELGLARERSTLPFGKNVNNEFVGSSLQQLRMDSGLELDDMTRMDVESYIAPDVSNESVEVYSREVPDLEILMSNSPHFVLTSMPDTALDVDCRTAMILLHSRMIFTSDGYKTP